jgi:hypothetical protein
MKSVAKVIENMPVEPPKRGRGRPRKPDRLMSRHHWEEEQRKSKGGRPAGIAKAIRKLEERLATANRTELVIDAIIDAAIDKDHTNQAAAWKLLTDRMLPMSYFEKDKTTGQRATVNITISGLDTKDGVEANNVVEGETIEG